jgi:hypothetical protein
MELKIHGGKTQRQVTRELMSASIRKGGWEKAYLDQQKPAEIFARHAGNLSLIYARPEPAFRVLASSGQAGSAAIRTKLTFTQ